MEKIVQLKAWRERYVQYNIVKPIPTTADNSTLSPSGKVRYQVKFSFKKPISKKQCLIIVQAGGRNGFVLNILLMFRSSKF